MGKMSRNKGSAYELKVAKLLTDWWGEGKFSRVPASGGLHWAGDQRVAGDIVPPVHANFPFVVECKKREGWTLDNVLLGTGEVKDWWRQVVMDARRIDKVPILFFSRNRAKDYIMLPYTSNLYLDLSSVGQVLRTEVVTENIREELEGFSVVLTTFDTLSQLSPSDLKDYASYVESQWDHYAEDYK
ncbi:RusA-like Holliday junction resolvase [Bacillus phage Shbh1]|uniref:Endonuclease-holliday junction resolvase-like protein n=1 Tax=Bacillus phage Shbh1 TaxID=1796992 RepID=A0A142F1H6_9CAUD|nr:RusA-like Holliday junction resolvase [Bacillus phage Shbh1]AMQ66633.1 endonuclease - holliday junction resolvase-like protein [Bacillus phage Shbh1]